VDAGAAGAFSELYLAEASAPDRQRRIAEMRGGGWGVADWSPDDRTLLVQEYVSANESYLWTLDVAGGDMRELTPGPRDGSSKVAYRGALFAADGASIYTTSDLGTEFRELRRISLADGEQESLSAHVPWDVSSFDLTPDGRKIVYVTNEAGSSRLRILDTATGRELAAPELPNGVIGGIEIHRNGRDVGFSLTSATIAGDAFSFDLETLEVERWTRSESGGLDTSDWAEAELVTWSGFDGLEISGFLYSPPARFTGKRPVIVNIHGGPEGQSRPTFKGTMNYFINELGIAVIYPNVRGSAGFGKTFIQLDNGFRREGSYRDIGSLLDWIAEHDDLDEDRVLVTGGSYGGFMTLAVATQYDDRICCSIDVVGISNLKTFLQNTQGYRRDLRRVEYGDERDPEMAAFLDRIAPMNHAENITKPIFIIQGANDPRVPKSESDQMVATLRRIGTPVWYMVGRNEGHGFRKKDNADFQFYATVAFVRQHLLN
ncbi:MAG: alpha/beta fold hydrolase, partial [Thermoanaerobaculia bacterium]|nr:alpha/beta fold hydrolase [Thermoanaerobaculia bacterium]